MANEHKERFRNMYSERYGSSLYKCTKCGHGPMNIKGHAVLSEPCDYCGAVDWRPLTEDEFIFETYLRDDLKLRSVADRQTLPFPIAIVYRKMENAANNTQRFSLLIELFEVVIRFVALVALADYLNTPKGAEALRLEIPEVGKLAGPSLGDWVSLFKSLLRQQMSSNRKPFLKEIKDFKLDRCTQTLEDFVKLRNDSLRGHGSTQTEEEYEIKFQEHSPKLERLIDELGFLANYQLVKTAMMEKDGDSFKISIRELMGDNPHFRSSHRQMTTPLDANKVFYLSGSDESLLLHPYVVLELCSECKRPEVLLLDKLQEHRIIYLSYESGHKPPLPTIDQLPFAVRELASRRPSAKP
jgi:hypothetical protein